MFKIKKHIVLFIAIVLFASFLRLWKLEEVPVSLFGDELDVGYHAYSILKTGKDYSGNFLPFHFHSLAEWRTPLYLYSSVPTVFLFGISALGVRLPAAIFGILGIVAFYFLVKEIRQKYLHVKSNTLELIASFVLAISPWHIQYSRGGFEVTQLLLFLILGVLFFLKGLRENKYLYFSAVFLALAPWIYSTAKLFIPIFTPIILVLYSNELLKVKKKHILRSGALFLILSLPILFSILFGGGRQRFSYLSVFSDPIAEETIGIARNLDLSADSGSGRVFHNKYVNWGATISNNLITAFSTDYLFINGDPNLRHSIHNMGMFYKVEIVTLLIGLITFFGGKGDTKLKLLFGFWLIAGTIPSAITREGGNHATRLIIILPVFIFLISYGINWLFSIRNRILKFGSLAIYSGVLAIFLIHYQHQLWIHNPVNSAHWWHYGWEQAIDAVKENEDRYDKIVISTANEPPWIFFSAWYEYPPGKWQSEFPLDNKVYLEGFGDVSHIDKFYFASPETTDVYNFGKVLDNKTLYLASAKEVGPDLVLEPERTPVDLNLIKAISYPSGQPAFYLFSKK